jgi:DNA-binding MarR family transcriptional regulator
VNQEESKSGTFDRYTELQLMEALESNPETTQADLATKAGVAVGTVNWYLKRWSAKGLVVAKRIGRWRWRYLLTPQGMAEKADLANRYFQASMRIYRQSRMDAKRIILSAKASGYDTIVIVGDGDIAEIVELTCLELGLSSTRQAEAESNLPQIVVNGIQIEAVWPEPGQEGK